MRWVGSAGSVICERKFCISGLMYGLIMKTWAKVSRRMGRCAKGTVGCELLRL